MHNKPPVYFNNSSKIVDLHRSLPKIVEQIQVQFISQLNTLLIKMLDKADDQLFDLADKAVSNKDQNLYFDAMRQLRIKRQGMTKLFSQELSSNFNNLESTKQKSQKSNIAELPVENLALVQIDQLEENLAIDSMVSTAKSANELALRHIVTRLDTLMANVRIEYDNNPLNPKLICEAFRIAVKSLEFDIKPILIVYKLFEREVITNLQIVYSEINNSLIRSGVLPDLRGVTAPKMDSFNQGTISSASVNMPVLDSGADFLNTIRGLQESTAFPATVEKEAAQFYQRQYSRNAFDAGTVEDIAAVNFEQLIQAVNSVQGNHRKLIGDSGHLQQMTGIRHQLGDALTIKGPVTSSNVGQTNDEIIGIVSMLFDFILDDKNLPTEFKALIGRLQIPMLKVALLDDSFFSKGTHPARKLINELAHAGVGWAEDNRIGLKTKVEEIVTTVIDEFENDVSLFEVLLDDFQGFMGTHKKRSLLIERRLQEAEEGKAKVESATDMTINAINELVGDKVLPETINQLIYGDWKQVMLFTCLRDGSDSDNWRNNLTTVENLISALTPDMNVLSVKQLTENMTKVVNQIKSGLDIVGYEYSYDENNSAQLFNELKKLHERALKGESIITAAEFEVVVTDNKEIPSKLNESDSPHTQLIPEIAELTEAIDDKETGSYFASSLIDSGPLQEDDEFMLLVEELQAGSWFETSNNGKNVRCKLAAVISSIGKYIFVDNTGKKVAEYKKLELALAFRRGDISQLDEGSLFDRALTSIVANYRAKNYQSDGLASRN